MPSFIPEWTRASGRNLHIKRVFNRLDERTIVRMPLRHPRWQPDWLIEHPERGWAAIAVCDFSFAEIDPQQLIAAPAGARFEQLLADFLALPCGPQLDLERLLVLWGCDEAETRQLSQHYLPRYGIRLVARERFVELGAPLIERMLTRLDGADSDALRLCYFPEAEIAPAFVARRSFARDNRARLFLDQQQEGIAKLDLELPDAQAGLAQDNTVRLINGVAGSGKTLIALHRARLLAELYPRQPILMLIHNTPIVADLRQRLISAHGRIPPNLEITTFFAWAHRQWRQVFRRAPRMPEQPSFMPQLLRQQRTRWPQLKLSDMQLQDEYDFINETMIASESAYLAASRSGRGFALRMGERHQVWGLVQQMNGAMAERGLLAWSALPGRLVQNGAPERMDRYHFILVDEAQFFAPSWFALARMALQPQGQLFLCADPNQGFMRHRLSWKSVGLDVTGRTRRLRHAYRSTRAILQAANGVLAELEGGDPDDYLQPDYAAMRAGSRPVLLQVASPVDAVDRIVNEVAAIAAHGELALSSVLIVYGERIPRRMLYQRLCDALGKEQVWWLNQDKKAPPPGARGSDCLRLAALDTATGLEGALVFLAGMEGLLTERDADDGEAAQAQRERDVRKLYMAMTRAASRLVLVASQPLRPALDSLFELRA